MNNSIALGIVITLLFISLVILFCIIIIKLYIQKIKKYNAQIYENEIAFQKTLSSSIIETQEQLLNSISQDLHDDAGQQLTVLNFQLENLKFENENYKDRLNPISESVVKLSQSLREISHSLNSNWLLENGLLEAIDHEVNRLKKIKTIHVQLDIENKEKKFDSDVQIVIFRIFQESINNILKHANATEIKIKIFSKPNFKIIIKDNGIGISSEKLNDKTKSIGLQNCINRAKMIQYTFNIESQLNNGTTITLQENN